MRSASIRLIAVGSAVALVVTACGRQAANPCANTPWIGSPAHKLAVSVALRSFSVGLDGSLRDAALQAPRQIPFAIQGGDDPTGRRVATWKQGGKSRITVTDRGRARVIAQNISSGPAWRPDGGAIAFAELVDGTSRVLVATADRGFRPRELGIALCLLGGPSWSPDGRLIALVSPRDRRDCQRGAELVVIDAQDGHVVGREAVPGSVPSPPAWSADGRYASESSDLGSLGIALVPRSGAPGDGRTIARCAGATWAPSGARLAAGCDGHLAILDLHTGARTDLETSALEPGRAAVWSADGTRIAALTADGITVATTAGHVAVVHLGGECFAISLDRFSRGGRRVVVTASSTLGD